MAKLPLEAVKFIVGFIIIGIGLGGSKDTCMVIGKRAACLRTVGNRNPDP